MGGGVYSFWCLCCASLGRLYLEIKCAVRVMGQVLRLYGAAVLLCLPRLESSTASLSYMNCPELVHCVPTPLANPCLCSNNCLPFHFQAVFCPPTHPPMGGAVGTDWDSGGELVTTA